MTLTPLTRDERNAMIETAKEVLAGDEMYHSFDGEVGLGESRARAVLRYEATLRELESRDAAKSKPLAAPLPPEEGEATDGVILSVPELHKRLKDLPPWHGREGGVGIDRVLGIVAQMIAAYQPASPSRGDTERLDWLDAEAKRLMARDPLGYRSRVILTAEEVNNAGGDIRKAIDQRLASRAPHSPPRELLTSEKLWRCRSGCQGIFTHEQSVQHYNALGHAFEEIPAPLSPEKEEA